MVVRSKISKRPVQSTDTEDQRRGNHQQVAREDHGTTADLGAFRRVGVDLVATQGQCDTECGQAHANQRRHRQARHERTLPRVRAG